MINQTKKHPIWNEWETWFNVLLSVPLKMIVFACTGSASDGVNLLPSEIRMHLNPIPPTVRLLVFDNCYVAARGPLAGLSFIEEFRKQGFKFEKDLFIPSPHHSTNPFQEDYTDEEIIMLKKKEKKALELIKKQFKLDDIGGILMEIIPGASGVNFYRPEFLKQLRELCTKSKKFLLVDEALTGLRTGKMFAFEHYADFFPDLVVFGKGFLFAGLAACGNWAEKFESHRGRTTVEVSTSSLLQSIQVMKRIHQDNLFQRSEKTGKVFLEYLRNFEQRLKKEKPRFKDIPQARGMGSLLWSKAEGYLPFEGDFHRFMPPISLTETLFQHLSKKTDTFEIKHCMICNQGGLLIGCDTKQCKMFAHLNCVGLNDHDFVKKWICRDCKSTDKSKRKKFQ
jgi:hypothetical protein